MQNTVFIVAFGVCAAAAGAAGRSLFISRRSDYSTILFQKQKDSLSWVDFAVNGLLVKVNIFCGVTVCLPLNTSHTHGGLSHGTDRMGNLVLCMETYCGRYVACWAHGAWEIAMTLAPRTHCTVA